MEYLGNIHPPAQMRSVFESLLQVAEALAVVDNHAHPICYDINSTETNKYPLPPLKQILSESAQVNSPTPAANAQYTLTFSRSIRDMHELLLQHEISSGELTSRSDVSTSDSLSRGSFAKQQTVVEKKRTALGIQKLAQICLKAAKVSAVLIDDGLCFPPDKRPISVTEFQTQLCVPVARRVLRLETEAELLLADMVFKKQLRLCTKSSESLIENAELFRKLFRQHIENQMENVVSFKSIAAYRSSLKINVNVGDVHLGQALSDLLGSVRTSVHANQFIRLSNPIIIDVVVTEAFILARKHQVPIQFHCGLGDPDVDLSKANPVLLRGMLHKFPDVPVVVLHGAWPYVREAAFLSSIYPNVYVDVGLAIPLLSVRGMTEMVGSLFEVAPLNRIMYSSDAHSTPDVFYLAARWGRRVVAAVAASSVSSGDLTEEQAKEAVSGILAHNAIKLYKLPIGY